MPSARVAYFFHDLPTTNAIFIFFLILENIKLMNVQSNFDSRHAMATKHSDCPNLFEMRGNGLMKSASTSSCCADEKILLKKLQNGFLRNVAANRSGANESERKLRVLRSLSHSEQNMPLLSSEEVAVKRTFLQPHKSCRYANSKHFSDCDFEDVQRRCLELQTLSSKYEEFSTHRKLDNVLTNNNSSIINFTAVNDLPGRRKDEKMPRNVVADAGHENVGDAKSETRDESAAGSDGRRLCAEFEKMAVTPSAERGSPAREEPGAKPSLTNDDEEKKDEKRFRRSSSLKTPKEATSNSAQKKIVRFADAMGLDLADVRTFLDELPSVPKSAYSDLRSEDVATTEPIGKLFPSLAMSSAKSLVPMFKQPGISLNFLDRVRDQFVCLENAVVCETPVCSITGMVRVRNMDFHKSVFVRYSSDNWRTLSEVQAVYVPDSCDGFSDKFSFVVYLYHVPPSQRIELAVRFHCRGSIFWDNNFGANYVFQSFASPPAIPSYFQCFPTSAERCHSFY